MLFLIYQHKIRKKYIPLVQYKWSGTHPGCDCTNSNQQNIKDLVFQGYCSEFRIQKKCQNIEPYPEQQLTLWKQNNQSTYFIGFINFKKVLNICAKTSKNNYLMTQQGQDTVKTCRGGKDDQFTINIPESDNCPIRNLDFNEIDPPKTTLQESPIYIEFSREQGFQPLISLIVEEEYLCQDFQQEIYYPLIKYNSKEPCSKLNKRLLASGDQNNFYSINKVIDKLEKLPKYKETLSEQDINVSIYMIHYPVWNQKCQGKKFNDLIEFNFKFDTLETNRILILVFSSVFFFSILLSFIMKVVQKDKMTAIWDLSFYLYLFFIKLYNTLETDQEKYIFVIIKCFFYLSQIVLIGIYFTKFIICRNILLDIIENKCSDQQTMVFKKILKINQFMVYTQPIIQLKDNIQNIKDQFESKSSLAIGIVMIIFCLTMLLIDSLLMISLITSYCNYMYKVDPPEAKRKIEYIPPPKNYYNASGIEKSLRSSVTYVQPKKKIDDKNNPFSVQEDGPINEQNGIQLNFTNTANGNGHIGSPFKQENMDYQNNQIMKEEDNDCPYFPDSQCIVIKRPGLQFEQQAEQLEKQEKSLNEENQFVQQQNGSNK